MNLPKGIQFKLPLSVELNGQSQIGAGLAPKPVPLFPWQVKQLDEFMHVAHYELQTKYI